MQKRKVLFVVHQLNYGGVQKAAITALNAIDYSKNEVTLYVRKNRVDLLQNVNPNVSQIILNKDNTRYYRKPYMVYLSICEEIAKRTGSHTKQKEIHNKLVSYLNRKQMEYEKEHYFSNDEKYDVAVSYISGYTAKFVADYVKAKKKVMFYHSSTDENHELHEEVLPCFDAIVGVNENVQKVLENLYSSHASKMTYIENYVDADEVRSKSKEFQVDKSDGKIVLCSCGRLVQVKGFDLAIEAAKILKAKEIPFLWYFVGDGPERKELEKMIENYGLKDCIQITGMQENPYPYIGCCDIYVQPSREEAHPLAIIEALILNKPVVTTATLGGKALVKGNENGRIANIDGVSLAEQIGDLIEQKDLYQNMCEFLEKIDYKESFLKYQNAWKKVLEEKE